VDKGNFYVRIYNFFVGLAFVPVILYKFIITWLSITLAINKASKILSEKLLEIGFSDKVCEKLTKEYASAKDCIFEGFLERKTKNQVSNTKKISGLRDGFIKILPGGQILLRIKTGHAKDFASAVFLDTTKIIILIVGISRALDRDFYWVFVCIVSYVLYSLLFGLSSELINKHPNFVKGLLGGVINVIKEALSDTKVVAIVGLALSSHSILGAPFVPLYHVIPNLDFVEHYISGFGIGLFAVKAYRTFISHISYSKALTILGSIESSHQILLFETSAELPFICYSTVFVGLVWEGLEEIVEMFTPRVVNVFFWNGVADVFMALLGALTAYSLVSRSFIIKNRKNCSNLNVKNAKVDPRAIKEASNIVLTHIKSAVDNVYSESSAKDFPKDIETHGLSKLDKIVKGRLCQVFVGLENV